MIFKFTTLAQLIDYTGDTRLYSPETREANKRAIDKIFATPVSYLLDGAEVFAADRQREMLESEPQKSIA